MPGKRKSSREKNLTSRYFAGKMDDDRIEQHERFTQRSKHRQRDKTAKTTLMRAAENADVIDINTLPVGQVMQIHSLFSEVEHQGRTYLCVVRKTQRNTSDTQVVVGDVVRFRDAGATSEAGQPEAVIEQVLPRKTLLTRADSFKARQSHPIVANAEQMLIVASLAEPRVKWGLIDRMIVAARAGGLEACLCLNKIDLRDDEPEEFEFAESALAHYASLHVATLQTSVEQKIGVSELQNTLRDHTTVLAGHSGVGKSSLIRAIQPNLDIRIGAVSGFNQKGRHTTTSARRYPLTFGGAVIDTPGVKLFGLWNVTRDNLLSFFPDVEADAAPKWRMESYARIESSLA